MKQLIFNDGKNVEIQKAACLDGRLHIRMILQTAEQLKTLFSDVFSTAKLVEVENGKELAVYENYTKLSYIKEEYGGIWEVELVQPEADLQTRITAAEERARENSDNLELAIAELSMAMADLLSASVEGGEA